MLCAWSIGLLALRILGTYDAAVLEAMMQFQDNTTRSVEEKANRLEEKGWKNY